MVTIRDVAKRAGVAVSTVSKVINNYPSVSEDTIIRVNEAIEELHFIPNSVAASLSSKQSGRVAVLTDPDGQTLASSEIMMQYIMGAVKAGNEARLDVVPLFFSMFAGMQVEEIEHRLEAQNIRSIIICAHTAYRKGKIQKRRSRYADGEREYFQYRSRSRPGSEGYPSQDDHRKYGAQ